MMIVLPLISFLLLSLFASTASSQPLILLSQERFASIESRTDLNGTGNNPSNVDCVVGGYSRVQASDLEPFVAQPTLWDLVQVECHTLLEVSTQASQDSRLSEAIFEASGWIDLVSYGFALTEMGGHVLGTSSFAVGFELTEPQDYELIGSLELSWPPAGLARLRLLDSTGEMVLVRSVLDDSVEVDVRDRLSPGEYRLEVLVDGECGLDCVLYGTYQISMTFADPVPTETTSMGLLKSRF